MHSLKECSLVCKENNVYKPSSGWAYSSQRDKKSHYPCNTGHMNSIYNQQVTLLQQYTFFSSVKTPLSVLLLALNTNRWTNQWGSLSWNPTRLNVVARSPKRKKKYRLKPFYHYNWVIFTNGFCFALKDNGGPNRLNSVVFHW